MAGLDSIACVQPVVFQIVSFLGRIAPPHHNTLPTCMSGEFIIASMSAGDGIAPPPGRPPPPMAAANGFAAEGACGCVCAGVVEGVVRAVAPAALRAAPLLGDAAAVAGTAFRTKCIEWPSFTPAHTRARRDGVSGWLSVDSIVREASHHTTPQCFRSAVLCQSTRGSAALPGCRIWAQGALLAAG